MENNYKRILNKHGFFFKKAYGQNFLSDESLLDEIVEKSGVCSGDTVLEIGLGAGALSATNKNNGGGGMGAKVSPAAVLMIAKDGTTKLVSLKSQDAVSKIRDMAPDILTKIAGRAKTSSEFEEEK